MDPVDMKEECRKELLKLTKIQLINQLMYYKELEKVVVKSSIDIANISQKKPLESWNTPF